MFNLGDQVWSIWQRGRREEKCRARREWEWERRSFGQSGGDPTRCATTSTMDFSTGQHNSRPAEKAGTHFQKRDRRSESKMNRRADKFKWMHGLEPFCSFLLVFGQLWSTEKEKPYARQPFFLYHYISTYSRLLTLHEKRPNLDTRHFERPEGRDEGIVSALSAALV